ncbi:SGNH/GDSL hydrolase family protein [Nocardioides sp. Bht2]|uniref:SGNH/GDSL hydrolase family protein n=1 Tax=Nocardioides sp. Bht2 TaxID=3392297 RepID=UPI0039B63884
MRQVVRRGTRVLAVAVTTIALAGLGGPALTGSATATVAAQARSGADGRTLDVVVLGDSYSAGNAAGPAARRYGPSGCVRSKDVWSERYAATLRARGMKVRVANHACSGGVAADLTVPRAMGSASTGSHTVPATDSDTGAAARLRRADPCNTRQFPAEEFWRYQVTSRNGTTLNYSCQRYLRPQTDFVDSSTDLVVFTMGGNDAGFTNIVMQCFLWKAEGACRTAIESAQAKLPAIRAKVAKGIAQLQRRGLRRDARVVQLGYPHLQADNGFSVGLLTSYPAGEAVRGLVTTGNRELAKVAADVNKRSGVRGQMRFIAGVPAKFAGHEPDAGGGNPDRWLMQILDPTAVDLSDYYHPNRHGQQAYADLLSVHGDFGAAHGPRRTTVTIKRPGDRVGAHRRFAVVAKVRVSDTARPRGVVRVRVARSGRLLATSKLTRADDGRVVLRVRGLKPGKHRLVVRYRGADGARGAARITVRAKR